jgi:hypothetical protein
MPTVLQAQRLIATNQSFRNSFCLKLDSTTIDCRVGMQWQVFEANSTHENLESTIACRPDLSGRSNEKVGPLSGR